MARYSFAEFVASALNYDVLNTIRGKLNRNLPTDNEADALSGASAPSASNPLVTRTQVMARGLNLVSNGYAEQKSDYNFSAMTYDGTVSRGRGNGVFKVVPAPGEIFSDELIPIDPERDYRLTLWAKSLVLDSGKNYSWFGLAPYDIDGNRIHPHYWAHVPASNTTLAAPLNPGDTTITLADASDWRSTGSGGAQRHIIFWTQESAAGYAYEAGIYSRQTSFNDATYSEYDNSDGTVGGAWAQDGIAGTVITLRAPWPAALGSYPTGTPVANNNTSGGFMYVAASAQAVGSTWAKHTGTAGGVSSTGIASNTVFPPATAFVRVAALCNRSDDSLTLSATNVTALADVSLVALPES